MPFRYVRSLRTAPPASTKEAGYSVNGTLGTEADAEQEQEDDACDHTNDDSCYCASTKFLPLSRRCSADQSASIRADRSREGYSCGSRASRSHREDSIACRSYRNTGGLSDRVEAAVISRAASISCCTLLYVGHAILPSGATTAAARNFPKRVSAPCGGSNEILRRNWEEGAEGAGNRLKVCLDVSCCIILPIASGCGRGCRNSCPASWPALCLVVAIGEADLIRSTTDLRVEATWIGALSLDE